MIFLNKHMRSIVKVVGIIALASGIIYGGVCIYKYQKANSHAVILGNGKRGFATSCVMDISSCHEVAGNTCPHGYSIIENKVDNYTGECK